MNNYISKDERKHIVRLGAVMDAKDEAAETYSKIKKVDKEYIKAIKMMGAFAFRALKIRIGYLTPEAAAKILNDASKSSIIVQWKDSVIRECEASLKLDTIIAMEKAHFFNLGEYIIEGFCKKCGGTVKDCPLKVLFDVYEMPIPYNDVPDNTCVYNYMAQKEDK